MYVTLDTWLLLTVCLLCFASVFVVIATNEKAKKRERELDQIERWLDRRSKQLEIEQDALNDYKRLHVRM